MTPEMTFECLLVSRNPAVVCSMDQVLTDFAISTRICCTSLEAASRLEEGSTDLIVIDLDEKCAWELLQEIWHSRLKQKPTIVAVAAEAQTIPGIHVVLRKPVTKESGTRSLRVAYSRMLQEHRKHVRYAVMALVQATDEQNRTFGVTVTNIGDGGIGLTSRETLKIGSILTLHLPLPGLEHSIAIQARVMWTRQYGAAGCEFIRIPPLDLNIMHDWLRGRCRIKKPLVDS